MEQMCWGVWSLENPPYGELAIVVLPVTRKVIVLDVIATMQTSTKLEVDGCCSYKVYTYKPNTLYIIILQTLKYIHILHT